MLLESDYSNSYLQAFSLHVLSFLLSVQSVMLQSVSLAPSVSVRVVA